YYALTVENLGVWLQLTSAILLFVYLTKINKYKMLFLTIFLPIFFTGLINVVFYSPLFITFCLLDVSELNVFEQFIYNIHSHYLDRSSDLFNSTKIKLIQR